MTPRRLIIWLIFLAAAVSLYFISDALDNRAEKTTAQHNRLVNLSDPLGVQSLELSGVATPKTIRIERRDKQHGWEMVTPVRYPADGAMVGQLLSAVVEGKIQRRIQDPGSLKQFGLLPPILKLVLTDRSGSKAVLWLGELSPNKEFAYASAPGADQVWMLSPALFEAVNRTALDLRDKRALDFVLSQVESLELAVGKTNLALKRVRGGADPLWRLADGGEADSEEVEDLLLKLHGLRAVDILDEGILPQRMGLEPPSGKVVLGLAGGGRKGLVLGGKVKERDETYLRRLAGGPVLLIKSASLDPLRAVTAFQLQQRRLLRFQRDQATALSLQRGAQTLKFARDKGGWLRSQPPGDARSGESVSSLIWSLGEIKWQKILGKGNLLGLDKPQAVITLTIQAADKKPQAKTSQMALKLGAVDPVSGLLAVQVAGDERVYGVKTDLLKGLPPAPPAPGKPPEGKK
ncbi:MAG: DUF4340 domain-containing protein [Desulfarculus sp.]|nr:MAG: DUF4340 domain-containing protein [Desulfarculus sp.]